MVGVFSCKLLERKQISTFPKTFGGVLVKIHLGISLQLVVILLFITVSPVPHTFINKTTKEPHTSIISRILGINVTTVVHFTLD